MVGLERAAVILFFQEGSGYPESPGFHLWAVVTNGDLAYKDQVLGVWGQLLYMTLNGTVISQGPQPMAGWRHGVPITKVPCLASQRSSVIPVEPCY